MLKKHQQSYHEALSFWLHPRYQLERFSQVRRVIEVNILRNDHKSIRTVGHSPCHQSEEKSSTQHLGPCSFAILETVHSSGLPGRCYDFDLAYSMFGWLTITRLA
jgi:hypothetical protein